MHPKKLRELYFKFFQLKGHALIESASLIPQNDASVLFNTAGMQPLVPFLLGQAHPSGQRIVNVQKCLRTVDFENIGDNTHHTFFQMLGNWSLGDYFKEDAIKWSFDFLTGKDWLNLPLDMLAFTCYKGEGNVKKDSIAEKMWSSLGVPEERIAFLIKDNFWSAGETGPCGPSSEMFYWTGPKPAPKKFDPNNDLWVEIWNDVFMSSKKIKRTILVDGMHTLYDKNFKLNTDLLATLNVIDTKKILTVQGFKEKGYELVKEYGYDAFSQEEKNIPKNNSEYFNSLLQKFKLSPEEVIYFDHKEESVITAKKSGILSEVYENPAQINTFLQKNLYGFVSLKQKNIDTGMGLERAVAVLQGKQSAYETELFQPVIKKLESLSKKKYENYKKEMRIIADHVRAAVFILGDENAVTPSNVDRGYILRRLIRRAVRYGKMLGIETSFLSELARLVVKDYGDYYKELEQNKLFIFNELNEEEEKFALTLEKGLREFQKIAANSDVISGKDAFLLFQSYGFPLEMTEELAAEENISVDEVMFKEEFEKHQSTSRTAAAGKFKGGLADDSPETTQLHTATHLLLEVLRRNVDSNIKQRGSNITPERLRFDFAFDRKLTEEEKQKVELEMNRLIKAGIEVQRVEMSKEEAVTLGAQMEFGAKYPERVSVYFVGDYSKEFCGGPHVKNTNELGKFKIKKEESSSAGVRRIKAVLLKE